jgi:hypothetical protein
MKIDTKNLKIAIKTKVPQGLILWNDIPFDLEKMSFESPLWREKKDDHATPTGGRVFGQLKLENDKILLETIQFENIPKDL